MLIVLSLNGLMAEEGTTAAKRHLITNAVGLIEHIYFGNALTSNFKSKICYFGEEVFCFYRKREAVNSFLAKKIRSPEKSPIGADGPDV